MCLIDKPPKTERQCSNGERQTFSSSCPVQQDQQETNVQETEELPNKTAADGEKNHWMPWTKGENRGNKWFR